MLKKTIRRLGALAMVLAMAVSVFAVNASAADGETSYSETKDVVIEKTISMDANAKVPNGEFTFALTPSETKWENMEYSAKDIATANADAVKLTDSNIKSSPTDTPNVALTDTATIKIDASKFLQPGIYVWEVKETGTYADGATCADQTKYLIVSIIRDGDKLKVASAGLVTTLDDESKNDRFVNEYASKKLDMSKTVEGLMGDKSKEFDFTVVITSSDANKVYAVVIADAKTGTTRLVSATPTKATDNGKTTYTYSVKMKHDGALTIYGLAGDDTWSVTETPVAGYTTNVNNSDTATNVATGTAAQNGNANFVNTATSSPATGVIMTIAPYALMVVLAGAFAVVFLTRRNRAE